MIIKSVIIDDETTNRVVLEKLLNRHCPTVQVSAGASCVDEGYRLILELKPDLVFLDVKMPEKDGFNLLSMFERIDFQIIFITGYDDFAMKAFEYSAVSYILKPIDPFKLMEAVERVEKLVASDAKDPAVHFVNTLHEKEELQKKLTLHYKGSVHMLDIEKINYIRAIRNYTEIATNEMTFTSSKTLSNYEDVLCLTEQFQRVNKSTIVNIHKVCSYTKGSTCFISLENADLEIEVSRRKKTKILQLLKD